MIRLEQYKGKWVSVFGLGTAGVAAVKALLAGEAMVYAWDDNAETRHRFMKEMGAVRHGQMRLEPIENWPWSALQILVLSPGVPLTHPAPHPVVNFAKQSKVRILGEVDLLHMACPDAKYIGITGTNGKSTTTALIAHILQQEGLNVQIGANFGTPALALRPMDERGYYVLEMSSYQLDLVKSVVFDASVLLNLTPDHLDRHGDMEGYMRAKRRIFDRQQDNDASFIGLDDGYCRDVYIDLVREHRPNVVPFTVTQHVHTKKVIEVTHEGLLKDNYYGGFSYDLTSIPRLKGRHNWQNIAAAYATARHFGLKPEKIIESVRSFPGLPHRLEQVGQRQGVLFINDSKATNADATARALEPFEHIYWILGGKPKAGGIDSLAPYFPKIEHAFLIGEAQDAFAAVLEGKVPYTRCGNLENATQQAANMALGDMRGHGVVLLSPACASFDQWKNYEQRGDAFRNYVAAIIGKAA